MSTSAEELRAKLASLDEADRAALAHFLICSLEPEADADAESAWDAELVRRGEEIASGKAEGEPAEKVFAEIRAKFA